MAFTMKTTNQASVWSPDIHTFAFEDAVPEALINQFTTVVGRIEGDRPSLVVGYSTDAGAAFYKEGEQFAESEPVLAEATCLTSKIGQLVRLSREQYLNSHTPETLAKSVARALTKKLDNYLLAQAAPTAPALTPIAGLLNVADTAATAISGSLDKLVDAQAAVVAAGGQPSVWVLSSDSWAAVRKFKAATDSNLPILGGGATDSAGSTLLGLPVVLSSEMPTKRGLLLSKEEIFTAVSPVEISTSFDRYFDSDEVAIKATVRAGWVVPRPARLAKLTFS